MSPKSVAPLLPPLPPEALGQTAGVQLPDGWLEFDLSPVLEELLLRALNIVVDSWNLVQAVAAALLKESTLTAARVYALIEEAR